MKCRERAQLESRRVQLLLRERLASPIQNYLTAKAAADRYRNRMIPNAENAYKLYLQKYSSMTAAYPQVLIAQRTLFQLKSDYVAALESAHGVQKAILIFGNSGFLLLHSQHPQNLK